MNFLFFKQADLELKNHDKIRAEFNNSDEFEKFEKRERKRVESYIEKVKEKRNMIIKEYEKQNARKLKQEIRQKKQLEELNEKKKLLSAMEHDFKKEEEEIRVKLKQDEEERLREDAERKKRWKEETRDWDKWERERSIAGTIGSKLDTSHLSKSFYKRNRSLAELKQSIKPRIENMSVVLPRSKEYYDAHSKIRKIEDIMQLSDKSQRTMRAKQLKELEFIVNTELNIKRKQEEKEKLLQQKIQLNSEKLGSKFKRHEHMLEQLEEDRIMKLKRIHFERDQKLQNINRTHKSAQLQLKLKLAKMQEEEEKIQELKKSVEQYKNMRTQLRQQLLDDMDKFKNGELDLLQIKENYKKSLIGDSEASSPVVVNNSLASPNSLLSDKRLPIRIIA